MESKVALTTFIDGQKSNANVKPTYAGNTMFMKASNYFLWAVLGVCVALTAFTTSANKPVRHLVVFKYASNATTEQIEEATRAFKALKNKIPGIISFEHGINISTEHKDQGFNHVYMLTFENVTARDAYLPHPDHEKFGQLLTKLKVVEDVLVVDFSAE